MAKTNWQDPKTGEIISPQISGLQEAVGKLEDSIGMDTVSETGIPLTEVFISNDDRYRIFQPPEGKRNWVNDPVPVIKKNGIIISSDFWIEYGGGAVVFTTPVTDSDVLTADATYTKRKTGALSKSIRFTIGTSTAGWTSNDCDYLCDGTADDVEINAAITALPTTGGEIVILDGTYNITARIDVSKENVTLKGNGNATVLKRMFGSETKNGLVEIWAPCKIEYIKFNGNKNTYSETANAGICIYNSSDVRINCCSIEFCSGDSICVDVLSYNIIITCNTCYYNKTGIYIKESKDNIVTNNICMDNDIGICLELSASTIITGNTCIRGNSYPGDYLSDQHTIRLINSSRNTVTNNNCMGKAPIFSGGTGNSVHNNKWNETDDFTDLKAEVVAHMAESANKFDKLFAFRNDIEIIAHRGFTQDFPENTLSALYAAAENKFHSTEFDIQISSDGEYMLMHDGTVDRTTDGTGDINDLTYAALRLLDAGTYKNARWAGAKIPTLEEYLLAGRGLFKTMYVELKNDFNETQIDEILAIIDDCDMTENVVIDSFYWDNLVRVRNANEFIPIGYHPASYADMVARIPTLSTMEYATIFAEYTILIANPTVVHTCRESGVDVGVYPILYSYEAQDMIDIGVVRLLSDVMIKGAK